MDRPGVVDREPDRYEPVEAPEAPMFPTAEPTEHGDRGYDPIKPRSGIGDLLRKLTAPIVGFGFLLLKFGGLLLKFKVVTTGASMLVSIAAYTWIWGLPFAMRRKFEHFLLDRTTPFDPKAWSGKIGWDPAHIEMK